MQTVEIVGRLLIALAVVLGVVWVIARKLRGTTVRQKLRTEKLIDVMGRQNLSRNSSIAVVRVAERALIVGVTDTNVRVLGEVEVDEVHSYLAAMDPTARRSAGAGGTAGAVGAGVGAAASAGVTLPGTAGVGLGHSGASSAGRAATGLPADNTAASTARDATLVASSGDTSGDSLSDLVARSGSAPLTAADIEEIRARRARIAAEAGSATPVQLRSNAIPISAARSAREAGRPDGALAGSALSPATWRQTINALRDMTARKG